MRPRAGGGIPGVVAGSGRSSGGLPIRIAGAVEAWGCGARREPGGRLRRWRGGGSRHPPMSIRSYHGLSDFAPRPANLRRHGRLLCQQVRCSLGAVLDISFSGMRVRSGSRPPTKGDTITIQLESMDACALIPATVVWSRRTGIFRHDMGLEFGDLSSEVRRLLNEVAHGYSYNQTLRQEHERNRDKR